MTKLGLIRIWQCLQFFRTRQCGQSSWMDSWMENSREYPISIVFFAVNCTLSFPRPANVLFHFEGREPLTEYKNLAHNGLKIVTRH